MLGRSLPAWMVLVAVLLGAALVSQRAFDLPDLDDGSVASVDALDVDGDGLPPVVLGDRQVIEAPVLLGYVSEPLFRARPLLIERDIFRPPTS